MASQPEQYQLEILDSLAEIPAAEWNKLLPGDAGPFLNHAFLSTLEESGCVGGTTGWQVAHLGLKDQSQLVGALPLYLKQHSYGEFVFDWSWAQAYEQQGMNYYPKALCAVPFTPVQGARILCAAGKNVKDIHTGLIKGLKTLLVTNQISSAHILFHWPRSWQPLRLKDLCCATLCSFTGTTKPSKVLSIFYPSSP